jgi:hypothetical protein
MNENIKTLLTVLLSGGFLTFLQFLINRHDAKHNKYAELKKMIVDGLQERDNTGKERYEENSEAIEELRKIMKELAKTTLEQKQVVTANSELLVGLAQDRLAFLTDRYIKRGVITLDELAILEEIYEPYHDKLGGNGRGKAGIEQCRRLPIVSEEIAIMKDKE